MQAQAVDEPDDAVFDVDDEDDEDDTYIDDGVVALVASVVQGQDDDFFIWYLHDFVWRLKRQFTAMTIDLNIIYIMLCPKTKVLHNGFHEIDLPFCCI